MKNDDTPGYLDQKATPAFMLGALAVVAAILAIGVAAVNYSPIGCGRLWC